MTAAGLGFRGTVLASQVELGSIPSTSEMTVVISCMKMTKLNAACGVGCPLSRGISKGHNSWLKSAFVPITKHMINTNKTFLSSLKYTYSTVLYLTAD